MRECVFEKNACNHAKCVKLDRSVVTTLIDIPSKVKEILEDPDMAQDNSNNTCLFGAKLEEKLLKDTNAKQK